MRSPLFVVFQINSEPNNIVNTYGIDNKKPATGSPCGFFFTK
jgi:hypothetical protein